jgi:hypothetical protein
MHESVRTLATGWLAQHEGHGTHVIAGRLEREVVAESLAKAEVGPTFSIQELKGAGLAHFARWEAYLAKGVHTWLTRHNPPVTLAVHDALAKTLKASDAAANPLIQYIIGSSD